MTHEAPNLSITSLRRHLQIPCTEHIIYFRWVVSHQAPAVREFKYPKKPKNYL